MVPFKANAMQDGGQKYEDSVFGSRTIEPANSF